MSSNGQGSTDGPGSGHLPIRKELEVDKLFRAVVKLKGSHLLLKAGRPPFVRVEGKLVPLNCGPISDENMVNIIWPLLDETPRRRRLFDDDGGVDFAHTLDIDGNHWRFRVNAFQQSGLVGLVARCVNITIPRFEELHLPPSLENLCKFSQGMILLAGTTGSGKTTTIAAMLDWINHHYKRHVLTLEDPVEFVFTTDLSLINQREIGTDVKDFMTGMKHAVREDPDVMLVGEMRDRETFETAIQAAETGHLVFGTYPRLDRSQHGWAAAGPVSAGYAQGIAQRNGAEHEGDHGPDAVALYPARRRPSSGDGDNAVLTNGPQATAGRERLETA